MASSESEYDEYSEEASDSEYSDDDSDSQYSQEDVDDDGDEYEDDDEEEDEYEDEDEDDDDDDDEEEDDDEYYDDEEEEVQESEQLGEDELDSVRDSNGLPSLEYNNGIENVNLQKDPDEISELNDRPFSTESTPSDVDAAAAENENLPPKQDLSSRAGIVNTDRDNAADSVLSENMEKININDNQTTVS